MNAKGMMFLILYLVFQTVLIFTIYDMVRIEQGHSFLVAMLLTLLYNFLINVLIMTLALIVYSIKEREE